MFIDNFDWVFSYEHLYDSYLKCRCGVSWKASVQKFITNAPTEVWKIYVALQQGRWRPCGFYEFTICERGKERHIKAVGIRERVVQRCLCDYALVPALSRSFIYDNAASQKGKGYDFAINRLTEHLRHFYRVHGRNGYILLYDFHHFFDSIPHSEVKAITRKYFHDPRLIRICDILIDEFDSDIGLGLGSQISQIYALAVASPIDHYVQNVAGIGLYGRYMDDGRAIHQSKDYLEEVQYNIGKIALQHGIRLNGKKTKIIPLTQPFRYLKVRFLITDTGKVVRKLDRGSITRERQKLPKLRYKYDHGIMTYDEVKQSYQSWDSHAAHFDAWHARQNMRVKYNDFFWEEEWIEHGRSQDYLYERR